MFAKDDNDNEVDPPMEIHVLVQDENDNPPVCENEESTFEVQEDEPVGKMCVRLLYNPLKGKECATRDLFLFFCLFFSIHLTSASVSLL